MTEEPTEREAAKRRLMFVPGEDFYFLAYTTFVLLDELKRTSPDKALYDSRKIAYLADFLGSDSDLALGVSSVQLSQSGKSRLSLLYDRAAARLAPLERIRDALVRREIIGFTREADGVDKIYFESVQAVYEMLNAPEFEAERLRIRRLRAVLPQLRTMTLATMKKRLFADHGVHTWGD